MPCFVIAALFPRLGLSGAAMMVCCKIKRVTSSNCTVERFVADHQEIFHMTNYVQGVIFTALILIATTLVAPVATNAAKNPITIEADQMSSTETDNTVKFSGNVDAKQGDLQLRSDTMTVYYTALPESGGAANDDTTQRIEKLVCVGDVEITREDWLGTADKMTYYADTGARRLILSGNAKAWQGGNMVSGREIIYYPDEGRSEVVGGAGVVLPGSDDGAQEGEKKERVQMTIRQN
jgi:lipopolysaccharide export system protein LptA